MRDEQSFMVSKNTLLRGVVGSTALGTALDGADDRDEMAVFVEPPEYVLGTGSFDHLIRRTQPEGVRSGPGDLDYVAYSLRKFCRLAAAGNPSVLILLYLPKYERYHPLADELLAIRPYIWSRDAGRRFLGYLVSQKMKLTGEKTKAVNRPELVERFGFDTKFAMHALRLGMEGVTYLQDARLNLPHPEEERRVLMAVRKGEVRYEDVLKLIAEAEEKLRRLLNDEAIPNHADYSRLHAKMKRLHLAQWCLEC